MKDSAQVGRMMRSKNGPKPLKMLRKPCTGTQRSSIANIWIRMYPTTTTGTEKPSTDRPITKRSIQVPCFQAAITPRGTATTTARMMVDSAIEIDGSTRWPIIFITGRLEMSDVPRSPWSSLFSQVMNCTISGSLRPSEVRMRSSRSGVALSPARIAAGSPGVRRSRRKTNSATTPITGTAARIRRRRYPSKLDPVRLESNQRQRLEPGSCHQPNISAIPMPSEPRFLQCGHLALVTWPGFGVVARPLLESREQPRHQPAAFDQTFDLDILFERVAVAATHAQAVESRDAYCAREIAVGAAA